MAVLVRRHPAEDTTGRAHLEDVIGRREWYLDHPAMLDLTWAGERVRDEASVTMRDRSRLTKLVAAVLGLLGVVAGLRRVRQRRRKA